MKITVIYQEFFQTGSHRSSRVHFKVLEVNDLKIEKMNEEIDKALEKENIDPSQVNFIFKGECELI